MSEGAQRDVTLNLRLVGDPKNQSVVSNMEKDVMSSYARMKAAGTKTAAENTSAAEKAAQRESKAAEKVAADKQKQDDRVFTNRAQLLARMARDEANRAQENDRNSVRAEKAAERAGKAEEREHKRAEQALERYSNKLGTLETKQERLGLATVRSSAHVVHGFREMAEGLALVGITSEGNTAKFMKMFAAVEGVSTALKGGLSIITGTVHTMSLLERATHAAAQEQKVLAQLQAAQAAVSAGSGAAGGIASGLASRVERSVVGEG